MKVSEVLAHVSSFAGPTLSLSPAGDGSGGHPGGGPGGPGSPGGPAKVQKRNIRIIKEG